jgi:hypothetical protein
VVALTMPTVPNAGMPNMRHQQKNEGVKKMIPPQDPSNKNDSATII